ncbi:MAG TPA: SDR family NAD(P)-dependent oxidoreductase [Chondromyces sp.]|nr:SDR family NAD(P)-dependent oxidoreductase [Chondromyces sp.]
MFENLRGKVAIVTGGASGIGAEVVRLLGSLDVKVISADFNRTLNIEYCSNLSKNEGIEVTPVETNVKDEKSIRDCVNVAVDKYGKVDILVNSAGIARKTSYDQLDVQEWDDVVDSNLKSVMFFSKETIPFMKKNGFGRIINISSLAGRVGGLATGSHYVSSKAGVIGLTKYLAKITAADGITANAVAPGIIDTPMTADYPKDFNNLIPMGRRGEPKDIANVILFLSSDLASYITGVTIDVNGGMYMG